MFNLGTLLDGTLYPWLTPLCSQSWIFDSNGLIWGPGVNWRIAAIIGLFCVTVLIQYSVVYFLLKRPSRARGWLFLVVLLANAIANPFTQLVLAVSIKTLTDFLWHVEYLIWLLKDSFGVAIGSAWRFVLTMVFLQCTVQLVVLGMELALLWWFFRFLFRRGALDERVTVQRTLMLAIAAKLASFVFEALSCWLFIEIVLM